LIEAKVATSAFVGDVCREAGNVFCFGQVLQRIAVLLLLHFRLSAHAVGTCLVSVAKRNGLVKVDFYLSIFSHDYSEQTVAKCIVGGGILRCKRGEAKH
jgi:hypothetical protein